MKTSPRKSKPARAPRLNLGEAFRIWTWLRVNREEVEVLSSTLVIAQLTNLGFFPISKSSYLRMRRNLGWNRGSGGKRALATTTIS